LRRDNARSAAVSKDLVGSPLALFPAIADTDQRHVGEPLG
jgi:hypothetical protein